MNKILWDKIQAFDFDEPVSEYGFSTRLANENYWTREFTRQAILEYKKFMYLAASSDFMVSPSAIVDTVWHQHLIFTQLYQDFCNLIGKQVQHVPSTHNREDFQKFKQAKERTTKLYEEVFGKQPAVIWHYNDMYESLHLKKAILKIRTFAIIGIVAMALLMVPFYYLLLPVYRHIDNPDFFFIFLSIAIAIYLFLEFYNRARLKKAVQNFNKECFLYHLHPSEVIYLKTQKTTEVVNNTVNEMILHHVIMVNDDNTIELDEKQQANNDEQLQCAVLLQERGKSFYPLLLKQLIVKPIFSNTPNAMNAFNKFFYKSQFFGRLFYLNFCLLAVLLLLLTTRITTGIIRDKPVIALIVPVIALMILMFFYLKRLTRLVCTSTIPSLYKKEVIASGTTESDAQWQYFLAGKAALAVSFIPLITYIDRHKYSGDGGAGCGSSCGSNCGSSCGSSCSSCGGCGGGD